MNAAAINLVKSSNPQDKVFVVNFNEEYFLDQDYTAQIPKLKDALGDGLNLAAERRSTTR